MILPDHEPLRWFIPYTSFISEGDGTWTIQVFEGSGGPWEWQTYSESSKSLTALYSGTIDLGGLERQAKTLNPLGYSVARWACPSIANSVANGVILQCTWVTSIKPIPDALVDELSLAYSIESAQDYSELIGFQCQTFSTDNALNVGTFKPVDTQTMGALQATAVPTLHTQLMVDITCATATTGTGEDRTAIYLPPSVVTIPQDIVKEEDLEYIYRLKRYADPNQVEN